MHSAIYDIFAVNDLAKRGKIQEKYCIKRGKIQAKHLEKRGKP